MTYITKEYYDHIFQGEPVAEADFPSLCQRAGEIVEEMTMYRLTGSIFASMPEGTREHIRDLSFMTRWILKDLQEKLVQVQLQCYMLRIVQAEK